jgi:NTE family protein
MTRRPKLGLVLSGGGARGLAHIGVLKALEANHIQIDYLAGTSMGGVIAAAYAAGLTPYNIEQIALSFQNNRELLKLVDPAIPGAGLLRGEQVTKFFREHIGDRMFEDLHIPTGLVAVDIVSGTEVHFHTGSVIKALRATVSVPGLFDPVETDGQRLVDGGLLNNLPVDVAFALGADLVLAVDVMTMGGDKSYWQLLGDKKILPGKLGQMVAILGDSLNLLMKEHNQNRLNQFPPAYLLQPDIPPEISVVSGYNRAPELIAEGIAVTESIIPELKQQIRVGKGTSTAHLAP